MQRAKMDPTLIPKLAKAFQQPAKQKKFQQECKHLGFSKAIDNFFKELEEKT